MTTKSGNCAKCDKTTTALVHDELEGSLCFECANSWSARKERKRMIPTEAGWYIGRVQGLLTWRCIQVMEHNGSLKAGEVFMRPLSDFEWHSRIEMPDERKTDGE